MRLLGIKMRNSQTLRSWILLASCRRCTRRLGLTVTQTVLHIGSCSTFQTRRCAVFPGYTKFSFIDQIPPVPLAMGEITRNKNVFLCSTLCNQSTINSCSSPSVTKRVIKLFPVSSPFFPQDVWSDFSYDDDAIAIDCALGFLNEIPRWCSMSRASHSPTKLSGVLGCFGSALSCESSRI